MSRIGKNPVSVPSGVSVDIAGQTMTAKGKLGTLKLVVSNEIVTTLEDGKVWVKPKSDTKRARTLWGTTRALVNNMVTGVTSGFTKGLEISGVGYRAQLQGTKLVLALGYSHPVEIDPPEGISFQLETPTRLAVVGADKELVGQTAAYIRSRRKPEPYKGKGIRYAGEQILRKAGKAGKVGGAK